MLPEMVSIRFQVGRDIFGGIRQRTPIPAQ
jgi:hypothetical protein